MRQGRALKQRLTWLPRLPGFYCLFHNPSVLRLAKIDVAVSLGLDLRLPQESRKSGVAEVHGYEELDKRINASGRSKIRRCIKRTLACKTQARYTKTSC